MRSPRQAAGRAGRHDARNSAPWRFLGGNATWSFHGPALPRETPGRRPLRDAPQEPSTDRSRGPHSPDLRICGSADLRGERLDQPRRRSRAPDGRNRPPGPSAPACPTAARSPEGRRRTHQVAPGPATPAGRRRRKTPPTSKHVSLISRGKSRVPRRVNVRLVSQRRSRRK